MLLSLGLVCSEASAREANTSPADDLPMVQTAAIAEFAGLDTLGQGSETLEVAEAVLLPPRQADLASPRLGYQPLTPSPATVTDAALATGRYETSASALAPQVGTVTAAAVIAIAPLVVTDSPRGLDVDLAASAAQPSRSADHPAELLAQDPELGVIQVRGLVEDNDLGILRIREQPTIPTQAEQPAPKIGFLSARIATASSDNVLLAVNNLGGFTGDTFFRPSLGLGIYPALGPQTAFIAAVDVGLQRYGSQSTLNYDDLRFRVGLRQGLTPRSYAQLLLTYQELFRPGGNRGRFFKNTALGLTLGRRDPIAPNLALDSYYLVQFNGAQSRTETASGPISTDFSRIFHSAGAYLGYDITPQVQTGISYQINLFDYTSQERYDTLQQVIAQVAYRISPTVRISIYGGVSFGRSSEPRVRFNDTFFGAVLDANIPLF